MNEHVPLTTVRTTQFAEGLPRRAWTVAEYQSLWNEGIFGERERLELIGGVIVPMAPKGIRHEIIRSRLAHRFSQACLADKMTTAESPLTLDDLSQPVPDIIVHPIAIDAPHVRGETAILVIEIGASSLKTDLTVKAQAYAAAGVRDYWVINAETLITTVFRDPAGTSYQSRDDIAPDQTLTPLHAPELKRTLNDLCI